MVAPPNPCAEPDSPAPGNISNIWVGLSNVTTTIATMGLTTILISYPSDHWHLHDEGIVLVNHDDQHRIGTKFDDASGGEGLKPRFRCFAAGAFGFPRLMGAPP